MPSKLDTPSSDGLVVKSGSTVLVDDAGRVFDQLPSSARSSSVAATTARSVTHREAALSPRHGQDIVIDPAGVAYSVRLHLAQHLHVNQRVAKLEATIAGLFSSCAIFGHAHAHTFDQTGRIMGATKAF